MNISKVKAETISLVPEGDKLFSKPGAALKWCLKLFVIWTDCSITIKMYELGLR